MTTLRRIVMGFVWLYLFQTFCSFVRELLFTFEPTASEYRLFVLLSLGVSLVLAIVGTVTGKLPGTGTGPRDGAKAVMIITSLDAILMGIASGVVGVQGGLGSPVYAVPFFGSVVLLFLGFGLLLFKRWIRMTTIIVMAVLLLWIGWIVVSGPLGLRSLSKPWSVDLLLLIPAGYVAFAMWYFSRPKVKQLFQ